MYLIKSSSSGRPPLYAIVLPFVNSGTAASPSATIPVTGRPVSGPAGTVSTTVLPGTIATSIPPRAVPPHTAPPGTTLPTTVPPGVPATTTAPGQTIRMGTPQRHWNPENSNAPAGFTAGEFNT